MSARRVASRRASSVGHRDFDGDNGRYAIDRLWTRLYARLFIHSGIYPPRPRGQLIIPNQARLQARSRFNNVAISHFNTGISSARRESALLRVNDLRSLMNAHRVSERERARASRHRGQ